MDSVERLSRLTIMLHWLVAIPIIGLIGLGLYMTNFEVFAYYDLHKSIGILLSGIILVRVLWRLKQGWPLPVSTYSRVEVSLSKIVHWMLILSTVFMPITGMISSGASGHGFGIFGWEIMAKNPRIDNPEKVQPLSEFWSEVGENAHEFIGYLLLLAIVLHLVGALKHHFMDKDRTLVRMLGKG